LFQWRVLAGGICSSSHIATYEWSFRDGPKDQTRNLEIL
jgi:hypothetical protein